VRFKQILIVDPLDYRYKCIRCNGVGEFHMNKYYLTLVSILGLGATVAQDTPPAVEQSQPSANQPSANQSADISRDLNALDRKIKKAEHKQTKLRKESQEIQSRLANAKSEAETDAITEEFHKNSSERGMNFSELEKLEAQRRGLAKEKAALGQK